MSATTKVCSVSRDEFHRNATPIAGLIGNTEIELGPRAFSTGGFGWFHSGKVSLKLANGQHVTCQLGITLSVVNSKFAPAAILAETPVAAVAEIG